MTTSKRGLNEQEFQELITILELKEKGQDCTEERSALVKAFFRNTGYQLEEFIQRMLKNFPQEFGEVASEPPRDDKESELDDQVQLAPYERERMEKAQELAKQIGNLVNSFSYEESLVAFNQAMARERRTHQQALASLILNWINFVASDEYKADGRNEYSKEVFTKIAAFLKEQEITSRMPMI